MRAALGTLGYVAFHITERFIAGIPDTYASGANWIEFKWCEWSGTRPITPWRELKEQQKARLDTMHAHGDRAWVSFLITGKGGARALIAPWYWLKGQGAWEPVVVKQYCLPYTGRASAISLLQHYFKPHDTKYDGFTLIDPICST